MDAQARAAFEPALTSLLELAAALAAGAAGARPAVGAAHQLAADTDAALRTAVGRARAAGHTWAEIGATMNTSRQSAFQRFGRTQPDLADAESAAVAEKTIGVFAALAAGDYQAVQADLDGRLSGQLGAEQLAGVWASVTGTVGAFAGLGRPFARLVGEHTVVDLPMEFEAGEMVGRLAFDQSSKIAGLFVLRPDALR